MDVYISGDKGLEGKIFYHQAWYFKTQMEFMICKLGWAIVYIFKKIL